MAYIDLIKYGFKNSFRFDIIYHKFFRHKRLRINLIKSLTTNIFMICQWYIIYNLLTSILIMKESFILSNLLTILFIIFITPLFVLNIFMNHHWRQQIVDDILDKAMNKLRKKGVKSNVVIQNITEIKLYLFNMIREYINSVWFYQLNTIIIFSLYHVISLIGFNLTATLIYIFYMSLISSMYAFEYTFNNKSLSYRLNFAEKNWCYLISWSLPIVIFFWTMNLPIIIHWCLIEFWTMIQTISSLYIPIPASNKTDMPIMFIQRKIVPIITNKTIIIINNTFDKLNKKNK